MRQPSFNPRPRMAGDALLCLTNSPQQGFNPRPRMAGDITQPVNLNGNGSFNPRPRMAGDSGAIDFAKTVIVSIHARVWRATP